MLATSVDQKYIRQTTLPAWFRQPLRRLDRTGYGVEIVVVWRTRSGGGAHCSTPTMQRSAPRIARRTGG